MQHLDLFVSLSCGSQWPLVPTADGALVSCKHHRAVQFLSSSVVDKSLQRQLQEAYNTNAVQNPASAETQVAWRPNVNAEELHAHAIHSRLQYTLRRIGAPVLQPAYFPSRRGQLAPQKQRIPKLSELLDCLDLLNRDFALPARVTGRTQNTPSAEAAATPLMATDGTDLRIRWKHVPPLVRFSFLRLFQDLIQRRDVGDRQSCRSRIRSLPLFQTVAGTFEPMPNSNARDVFYYGQLALTTLMPWIHFNSFVSFEAATQSTTASPSGVQSVVQPDTVDTRPSSEPTAAEEQIDGEPQRAVGIDAQPTVDDVWAEQPVLSDLAQAELVARALLNESSEADRCLLTDLAGERDLTMLLVRVDDAIPANELLVGYRDLHTLYEVRGAIRQHKYKL